MTNLIKRAIQWPLIQKRHKEYEARVGRQTVPFDVWIEQVIEEEKAGAMTCPEGELRIMNMQESVYQQVVEWMAHQDASEIILFTADKDALVAHAADLVYTYFMENPDQGILYGDENRYFKPGWSPDVLQSCFYFDHVFAVRGKLLREFMTGFLKNPKREQIKTDRQFLYEMVLSIVDLCGKAGHLDKILYVDPCADTQEQIPWGTEEEYDLVKEDHLFSDVPLQEVLGQKPLVSVIIPSKDNPSVVSHCIHTLREITEYQNFEIILVDNGSNEQNKAIIENMQRQLKEEYSFQYLYSKSEFNFSNMCNQGAQMARGEYLLFLNDDMEIAVPCWLTRMLQKAMREDVGAVGAKLLYPQSDKIQHLGVTNIHLGPSHKGQFAHDEEIIYKGYNKMPVNASGVTGACLLLKKEIWEQAGGWNEQLRVAFNDVEFCYHIMELGYRNVCCNDVYLYHHESLSRGTDTSIERLERLHQELWSIYRLHPSMWNTDPYYNRHFVTDILDKGFEPANRFSYEKHVYYGKPVNITGYLKDSWENVCLYKGIEYAGTIYKWNHGVEAENPEENPGYYFQGWSFTLHVDNSRYERKLLLQNVDTQEVYAIAYNPCPRPDQEELLPFIDHAGLCGTCIQVDTGAVPAGKYAVGYLWEDTCSRQRLYGILSEVIEMR